MDAFAWTDRFLPGGRSSVGRATAGFRAWWIKEARAALPERIALYFISHHAARLILRPGDGGAQALLQTSGSQKAFGRLSKEACSLNDLYELAENEGIAREDIVIALDLAAESCFFRSFDIPKAGEKIIDKIALAEIERKTPFRLDEIFLGRRVQTFGEKLRVHQVVIKRTIIQDALRDCGLEPGDVHILLVRQNESRTFEIAVLPEAKGGRSWTSTMRWLTISMMVLFILAIGLLVLRQQLSLNELKSEVASAKIQAMRLRAEANTLIAKRNLIEKVRLKKAESVSCLDIWQEVTRLLPNRSWLTELRLWEDKPGERRISMSGYSTSAARLVGLFAHSPLFSNVALIGAITPDPVVRRERFVIQADLRPRPIPGAKP